MNIYTAALNDGNFWDEIDAHNQAIEDAWYEQEAWEEEQHQKWIVEHPLFNCWVEDDEEAQLELVRIFVSMLALLAQFWFEENLEEKDSQKAIDAFTEILEEHLEPKRRRNPYL